MNPAFSVIFLTTLIGAGQGLFLALFGAEMAGYSGAGSGARGFFVMAGVVALALTGGGLVASFFHLGRPERAWRSAAMWRTSWLSREVIALPVFMGLLFLWTVGHAVAAAWTPALGRDRRAGLPGAVPVHGHGLRIGALPAGMGQHLHARQLCAAGPGLGLHPGHGAGRVRCPGLVPAFGACALVFTLAGLVSRSLSLARNARLKPRSTLQSAIGIRHPQVAQRSMGFMGGSFNTREFFHGKTPGALRQMKWAFLLGAFVLPLGLLALGLNSASAGLLALAFVVQYLGLLAERWFFLAQANHPQNLYYQAVS